MKREELKEQNRTQIIEAAKRLFLAQGIQKPASARSARSRESLTSPCISTLPTRRPWSKKF
ncbi:hypothetical protein AAEZ42_06665 [Limosilactobacillus fermentum]